MLKKLLAILKRLGIRPAIVQDYLGGFPTRPGQQPKITPKFTSAQLAIATALTVRSRQTYGWAPPPKQEQGRSWWPPARELFSPAPREST